MAFSTLARYCAPRASRGARKAHVVSTRPILTALLLGVTLLQPSCSRSPHPGQPTAAAGAAPRTEAAGNGAPLIVDSDDLVHIEYHIFGSGSPAVVLIHGWSCNSSYWRAQIEDLARRYTVVTLDLGGHGASGRNRSDWSVDNYAADVAAVARQLPAPTLVLVGHSMGGPVALAAAARIGARVIGIIGVDTFKSIGLPPPPRSQIEQELAPFRSDFIGTMHSFVPEHLFAPGADPAFVRKVTDDMARASPEVALASLISLNEMDFSTVLPRIHVPIIAINSDLGEATDETRITRAAPTLRVITLKGTGHFLMMEAPQRFNPVLLEQIAALAANPRT